MPGECAVSRWTRGTRFAGTTQGRSDGEGSSREVTVERIRRLLGKAYLEE